MVHIENKIPPGVKKQKICFDEWNVWDPKRAIGSEGAEEK
jgi:alpha-N-arabinofuranosidase